ncbi:hypothetical protein HY623_03195 [Candidatus Uhrbacteria bacterium]|nr:hypothetical protein [Candidatus Uhrbacteria bacterium]
MKEFFLCAWRDARECIYRGGVVVYITLFFIAVMLAYSLQPFGEQQYSYLAQSFLHGKLYFLESPGWWGDAVAFGGKYYWPLGPLPAILLMPFVLLFSFFGAFFYQGYAIFFITLIILLLWYRIVQLCGFSKDDARYAAFAFCFGSSYLMVALWQRSWFFAHAAVILLLSCALFEYLTKRRYWLIGVLMAAVAMTRMTAGVGIIFFIIDILFLSSAQWSDKRRSLTALLAPLGVAGVLLAGYNAARFGSVFEQGYALQILMIDAIRKARDYGLFSLIHVPANLYYMFLAPPLPIIRDASTFVLRFPYIVPNPLGMSIFLVSPYLLTLFFQRLKDRLSWALLVTCGVVSAPLMLYYATGYFQFGYRYSLDFFPFLFLLFVHQYRKKSSTFSRGLRFVIIASALVNLFLFLALIYTQ